MIMMPDGGMIGPMIEETAVIAALNSALKPRRFISRTSTAPRPAASAWATPDMPEKITLATMLTCPRLPRMWPTRAVAKSKIRVAMPAELKRLPARMNSGIARST